jgi:hypothetical protein
LFDLGSRDAAECKMTHTLGNVTNPIDFIYDKSLEKLQGGLKSSKEDYQDGIPECGTAQAQHYDDRKCGVYGR